MTTENSVAQKLNDITDSVNPNNIGSMSKDIVENLWNFSVLTVDKNGITVGNIIIAFLFFVIGFWYLNKFKKRLQIFLINKFNHDRDAANAIENIVSSVVVFIYVVIVLQIANIPLNALAFVGGALAISIGLGAQKLIGNFIASLIIMIEKPIKIGDFIKINDALGVVRQIGPRCITIQTNQMNEISIPNNIVIEQELINWTTESYHVMGCMDIKFYKNQISKIGKHLENIDGINQFDTEFDRNFNVPHIHPEKILEKLISIFEDIKQINVISRPMVYFTGIDDSYYTYKVLFDSSKDQYPDLRKIKSDINLTLLQHFDPENIILEH